MAWLAYTDKLEMEAYDPIISETTAILGEQAGLSIDTLLRATITDGATKLYSGSATTRLTLNSVDDRINYADVVGAIATAETNNARPSEGDMFASVAHPYTYYENTCVLPQ